MTCATENQLFISFLGLAALIILWGVVIFSQVRKRQAKKPMGR